MANELNVDLIREAIDYAEDALYRHDGQYGSYAQMGKWGERRERIVGHIEALKRLLSHGAFRQQMPVPTVLQACKYLESNGWKLEATRQSGGADWHVYAKENWHIEVPAMPEAEDFDRWMATVVLDLAHVTGRNAYEIARQMVQGETHQ